MKSLPDRPFWRPCLAIFVVALLTAGSAAGAQTGPATTKTGVVVDQTDRPIPGATVDLLEGQRVVRSTVTDAAGAFTFDASLPGDTLLVAYAGFEPRRVARSAAARIVLQVAATADSVNVVAAEAPAASASEATIGHELSAETVARMPSAHLKATESLPLLPSVVRGPDGLMQMGGARAQETPLLLDGFNVSDPATGLSTLDLPFESVKNINFTRDPMAVSLGNLIGGVVQIDSQRGGDKFAGGVEGFIPRPQLSNPGFGHLEGFFPRVYGSGATAGGRIHYFSSAEWDYERIAVPNVTVGRKPEIKEGSAVAFGRLDIQAGHRQQVVIDSFVYQASTGSSGLSPLRAQPATADVSSTDVFFGVADRFVLGDKNVITVMGSVLSRRASLKPNGTGASELSPAGWADNWFVAVNRSTARSSGALNWERLTTVHNQVHDLWAGADWSYRRLDGRLTESPVIVMDSAGTVVRTVDFGPGAPFRARDSQFSVAARDQWTVSERLQVDGGARLDRSPYGGTTSSARGGGRLKLDADGKTVLKAGFGRFVGSVPLAAPAFGGYPARDDRWFDAGTGQLTADLHYQPSVGGLALPIAVTATAAIERRLRPGLDAQVAYTHRRSSKLAVIDVPDVSGPLTVESTGRGTYQEIEIAVRRTWAHDQQLFVSYVHSDATRDLNDFLSVFASMDAALLQPGGLSRLSSNARHRVLTWGTFNLPARMVVSPVVEWRSGFPYSALNARYQYEGTPNSQSFPVFLTTDLVIYKTITVRHRPVDAGVQVFNITNHRNPRDVYPVVGQPLAGSFTNSVGPVIRGYMMVKW